MKQQLLIIGLGLALLLSLGLLAQLGYTNYQLKNRTSQLNSKLMEADLELGKALTQFGDAKKYLGDLKEEVQVVIRERDEVMTRYGKLQAQYKILQKKKKAKTEVTYVEGPAIEVPGDCVEFTRGMVYEAITERVIVPVDKITSQHKDHRVHIMCVVKPYPNRNREIPVFIGYNMNMKIRAQLVETRTESGAINYYINIFEVDEKGGDVGEFSLTKFDMVIDDQTKAKFHWWAPHIDVGILLGYHTGKHFQTGGSLGMSFMGYGKTNNDLTWRFPRLSIDLSGMPAIGLTPVMYNLGDPLPIVSNIWIGPHISWGFKEEGFIGLWMGAVL